MTLRTRLALAFVAVVLLPVVVSSLIVTGAVPRALDRQASRQLQAGSRAASVVLGELCQRLQLSAEVVGRQAADLGGAAGVPPAAQAAAARTAATAGVQRGLGDGVAILAADGSVLAATGTLAARPPEAVAALVGCGEPAAIRSTGATLAGSVTLSGQTRLRRSVVVRRVDGPFVRQLAAAAGNDVTVVVDGRPVASTLTPTAARGVARWAARSPRPNTPTAGHGALLETVRPQSGRPLTLVVSDPRPASVRDLQLLVALVLLLALLLAAVIGRRLARLTTEPLTELTEAAGRVAEGALDTPIPVRSRDEVGRLAGSLQSMTGELRGYVHELETSRDELRASMARLGETLSSTHDLDRILLVILDTSLASVRADAGAVLLPGGRGDLVANVSRGLERKGVTGTLRIRRGEGITGQVAATGEPLCWSRGEPGALRPSADEPTAENVISVPLKGSGRVVGVLNLYDRVDGQPFDADDLDTIRSFAGQATVAIDNVLLHQEAQRLSITDGLTGLWNYRYFAMNIGKEIERANRFGRPMAVLMLDLDKFKSVNDQHGHQRGDSVLIELATRVKSQIREVDTLARYGGEELILVLPEADATGALHTAERICEIVRGQPFGAEGEEPIAVTVSIGAAIYPGSGSTGTALVRAADEALYAAKNGGRDQWRLAPVIEPELPVQPVHDRPRASG